MALENEQAHKLKLYKELQKQNRDIVEFQKSLEKEIYRLKSHGDVEKKFCELNVELKHAKDYVRKLQVKEREDQKVMQ